MDDVIQDSFLAAWPTGTSSARFTFFRQLVDNAEKELSSKPAPAVDYAEHARQLQQ